MSRFTLILAILALSLGTLRAAETQPRMMGIRVVGPAIADGEDELRAFNWIEGTTISYYIPSPGGTIIDINVPDPSVTKAVDDAGNDLREKPKDENSTGFHFSQPASVQSFASIAKDGSGALVDVQLPLAPGAGATNITLAATCTVVTASETATVTAESSDFAVGATITLGDMSFEVKSNGKPDWGDAPQEIELKTTYDIDAIAKIFIEVDGGKRLELDRRGHSSMNFMGKSSYSVTYHVPEKVTTGKLVIEHWTDRNETPVAIGGTVGLGIE